MPTMGNVFCVRGRSGTGGRGAAGPFFGIFGPDGFFMVGILVTVEGGVMRVARYKAGTLRHRPGRFPSGTYGI
jgi:hypothetical protein